MSATNRRSWRRRTVLVVACVLLASGPIQAEEGGDFGPDVTDWNGLSYLRTTAAEASVDLVVRDRLDWAEVDEHQVLVLIAPKIPLDGPSREQLMAFVGAGGRLVVADDFRAGDSWVRPFGIHFSDRPGPAGSHDADRRYLPILDSLEEPELANRLPPLNRFLGFEVPHVVLNHPAAMIRASSAPDGWTLQVRGAYLDGVRAWLIEARAAAGRMLAIADSSVFINGMLTRYRGNKQFAANVLRYYCYEGRPCRVILLPNLEQVSGIFRAKGGGDVPGLRDDGDLRGLFGRILDRMAEIARSPFMLPLWWILVLVGLAVPILLAARASAPLLPPRVDNAGVTSVLFETVRAWLARPGADYRRPARQLALHLSRMVAIADRRANPSDDPVGVTPTLVELPDAIASLVERGLLSAQAGKRLNDVVLVLRQVAGGELAEVDRIRFTQLAAEVEWAEHVLSHTGRTE